MSFGSDIAKFEKDFMKNSKETIKAASIETFENIIYDSPVNTGNFVGNWHIGDNAYRETTSSQGSAIAEMKNKIEQIDNLTEVEFINNTPYGIYIEYGSSTEAPSGMLRINEMKWDKTIQKNGKPL